MKQQIETCFPHAKNCFESTESEICSVAEHEQTKKCYLIDNTEEGILKISNASKKMMHLLAIDACIFSSKDERRCDCAVFDDKVFYFIEIKDCSGKKRRARGKDAIPQLRKTLEKFLERLDFKHYQQNQQLNALICFRFQKRHPAQVTTSKQNEVDFWDSFNAKLLEGNEINL